MIFGVEPLWLHHRWLVFTRLVRGICCMLHFGASCMGGLQVGGHTLGGCYCYRVWVINLLHPSGVCHSPRPGQGCVSPSLSFLPTWTVIGWHRQGLLKAGDRSQVSRRGKPSYLFLGLSYIVQHAKQKRHNLPPKCRADGLKLLSVPPWPANAWENPQTADSNNQ